MTYARCIPHTDWTVQCLSILGLLGIMLLPASALAQVNIEPFSLGREYTGLEAKVGANFKMETNETVLLEIDLSPRVDYVRGKNSVSVVGNLGFSERAGTTFRSVYLLHTRYLLELGSTLSAEFFARTQRDEFALLSNRVSSGAGLRFEVVAEDEAATYTGFSFGFERERWEVEPSNRHPETLSDPRAFGYLAYRLQISENATLLNTLNASLRLGGDLEDGRITDTATLDVGISDRVSLQATFALSFDTRPPEPQPEMSLALTNGLTVSL